MRSPIFTLSALLVALIACGHAPPPPPTASSCPSAVDVPAPPPSPSPSLSASAAAAPAPQPPKSAQLPKSFDIAAIDAFLAEKVKEPGLAGLSAAIVKEGKIVLAKGYGKRSLKPDEPADASTAFAIGSVTKQFVCAAIFMLAEEKKLSVDDPVAKYFPKLNRAKDIRLHDLMTHTSGYHDYYPLDFVHQEMSLDKPVDTIIGEYASKPLDFEPGTKFSYSNTGYLILGRVVEKVSGKPLAAFLEERIFKRLGMEHSLLDPAKGTKGVAPGHTSFLAGPLELSLPEGKGWLHAAGGIAASAKDIAKWDLGLMESKVLSQASFDKMGTPRKLSGGKISDYACGIVNVRRFGETLFGHSGAVSGSFAYNAFIPRIKGAVVLLSNADSPAVHGIHQQLLALLIQTQEDPVPKVQGPPPEEAVLAIFHQLQAGKMDRSQFGADANAYLSDARVAEAAPRLKALGEPQRVEMDSKWERGGMQANTLSLVFEKVTLKASIYRTPDGKVQQFMLRGD